MTNAKFTELDVKFNNQKVTESLNQHLINWTYTDNLSDQIDDLNITLEDKDAIWLSDWFPTKGTIVEAIMFRRNWDKRNYNMDFGKFEIDTVEGNGNTITIMAMATSSQTSLRGQERSQVWDKVKVKKVFEEIAKRHNLKLYWQTEDDPTKERLEQLGLSDLSFMHNLCKDEGLCLKITNNSIVVLDEHDFENKAPEYKINRKSNENDEIKLISYSWKTTLTDVYKSCRVVHKKDKKNIEGIFTPKNPPKTSRILEIRQEVSSVAEAQKLAKKKLREKNKNATTFSLSVYSVVPIRAGAVIEMAGFGKLNGRYIVSKVTYSSKEISLDLRRCLEGY